MDCCPEEKKEGKMMCNKCKECTCKEGKCDKCGDKCEMKNHK